MHLVIKFWKQKILLRKGKIQTTKKEDEFEEITTGWKDDLDNMYVFSTCIWLWFLTTLFAPKTTVSSVLSFQHSVLSITEKASEVAEITLVQVVAEEWVHPGLIHAAISWLPTLETLTFTLPAF